MILAALFCLAARAAESVEAEARRTGKGVIILQVGSDWCVAGEKVRKVFESEEFRKKVAEKFVLAVYDEAENISKETAKANERTQSLLMRTQCFPAMTCYTPAMKISAHHFCISQDITADNLAAYAQTALASGKEIERLSAEAGKASGEAAANLYGQIFDMFTGDRRSMQDLEREPSLFKEIGGLNIRTVYIAVGIHFAQNHWFILSGNKAQTVQGTFKSVIYIVIIIGGKKISAFFCNNIRPAPV